MPDNSSDVRITTGQVSFEGGVDSGKVVTIASPSYPDGLQPNMLAWGNNITVRGGGISTRYGWKPLVQNAPWSGLFQSAYMYETDTGIPYIVISVGGRIYRARVDSDNSVEDLSAAFGLTNPDDQPESFFTQGEEFLIIQAGDLATLPLFWDGTTMRRSVGGARVVGVTAANFVVPAVGQFVDVTLTANYNGTTNQIVTIGAANYMQVIPANFSTFKNIDELGVGGTVPTGTGVYDAVTGNLVTTTLGPFTIPAVGAPTTPDFVFISPTVAGPFPKNVTIIGQNWQITAVGHAAPGVKHVFLININDTAGNTVTKPVNLVSVPELPAAGPMDYFMGRIWYAIGRQYAAGDIVRGPSGTSPYERTDSVLKITENPLSVSGDGFTVPTNAGNIRGIAHTAELNTTLGQGRLYIGTRKAIYALDVPVTRDEWSDPAFANKQPLQTVAQRRFGFVSAKGQVPVNGDLWYEAIDGIRSFNLTLRNDQAWGNVPASSNERRAVNANDKALMHAASGIEFDSRLLMLAVPFQTDVGIAFKGILPLDFDLISSIQSNKPPAWEGFLEGLDILQLVEGDFGGLQRAFAIARSRLSGEIEIWELTVTDFFDRQTPDLEGARVTGVIETPAYTWNNSFELKQLETVEIWYDRLISTVDFEVFFRPDNYPCWIPWHAWQVCAAKNCTEVADVDCDYPDQTYCESYDPSKVLPKPPEDCIYIENPRPANLGYQFQLRIVTKGRNRIRALRLHAFPRMKAPFDGLVSCPAPKALPDMIPALLPPILFADENEAVVLDDADTALDVS